jgi:hypothetical protein
LAELALQAPWPLQTQACDDCRPQPPSLLPDVQPDSQTPPPAPPASAAAAPVAAAIGTSSVAQTDLA